MRLEKDDAKIGLLVFVTLALFVGFIFYRSLTAILRKESHLLVRLDSASDVAEGTEVQLQGLRVGQVEGIELRREGVQYQFLVHLGLRRDIVLWRGTRVLVVSKPLGGAFLDLQLPPPDGRREVLAEHSILPGAPGTSLAGLIDKTSRLMDDLDQGVGELRAELRTHGLGAVLDHPQVARAFRDLDAALEAYRKLAEDGQGMVRQAGGAAEAIRSGAATIDQTVGDARALLDRKAPDLEAAATRLATTLQETEALARDLRATLQKAGPDGDESLKSLDRTLRSAEELLELLKAKPNRLLWGKPSAAEQAAAAQKIEAKRKAQGAKP